MAGGKVAILHFKLANSCIERVNGFSDAIDTHNAKKKTGKIQIVAELPGGAAKDESYHATRDALQAYPDLAGIFAINDPSALGAVAAIEEVNKADQVKIIGFDGSLNGRQAIKEGRIIAAPIHFPERMGVQTMKTMIKYLKGKKVTSEQLIPMELYRRVDAQKDPSLEALE
jgi:ribose transport system substrate-binding protein